MPLTEIRRYKMSILKKITVYRVLSLVCAVLVALSGTAVFAEGAEGFTDIDENSWAYSYIEYCIQNGIMNGVSETEFMPDGIVSDVMVKLVLERITGREYHESYSWSEPVTREYMAYLMYSAAGSEPESDAEVLYSDSSLISSEYYDGVIWCSVNGIMNGKENEAFDPSGLMTRSELAAAACRLMQYLSEDVQVINIIHTNDVHGYDVSSDSAAGIDYVAALKQQTDNAILADAGDATQGLAFASLDRGASAIEAMNLSGYDVMSCGNHEFDYGWETAKQNAEAADFPIISANTVKDGAPFFSGTYRDGTLENNGENTIIEVDGIKVGFFGILTASTATSTKPSGIEGITFEDEIETTREQIGKLRDAGADVIIGLFHVGVNDSAGVTTPEIADAVLDVPGLDAIIDGHSHTVYNSTTDSGILIAQTGSNMENVGVMSVSLKDGEVVSVSENMLSAEELRQAVEPDAEVTEYLSGVTEAQNVQLGEKIAETSDSLWGGYVTNCAVARTVETNLGNLICDAMIWETKNSLPEEYSETPIVAIENGGGIRASIMNGDITRGDIFNVLPFGNTLYVKEVTPALLYEVMENSVKGISAQDTETGMLTSSLSGGFLQIGGMTVTYEPAAEAGQKVQSIVLSGESEPLDRNDSQRTILLAMNDFIAAGGNDYTMLVDIPEVIQGTDLEEILRSYILMLTDNASEPLSVPNTQNRLNTVSDYEGGAYTASLYLKDADGNLLKNSLADVYVDGERHGSASSNENGIVRLELTSGPHSIKIGENGEEAYVNNIFGLGIIELDGDYQVPYPTLNAGK